MEYSRTSLIVLISIQLVCIDAFSRGAPYFQCAEMRPSHGNQSESLDKFIINVYTDVISPGSQIEVNISSTDPSVLIMGVLVQAKSRVQNKYVGSFVVMPKTTKSVCVGNTGITHRQRLLVPNLNLVWNAPANLAENDHITFNATIVQNHRVYWQGVESRPVQVSTASPVVRIPDSTQSTRDWQPVPTWNFTTWWNSMNVGLNG